MQDYHELRVWKRAHPHAIAIRKMAHSIRRTGFTSLKSQLIRAAESIVINMVEGCGAATRKEFARFLDISIKSMCELEGELQLARDNGAISQEVWETLSRETIAIRRMTYALRRSILNADANSHSH